MKRLFATFTGLAVAAVLVVPAPVGALTAAELQAQIDALLAQLADLQSQLSDLTGDTGGTVAGCTISSFDRNLSVGMTGADVKCLQIVLNTSSDTKLADSGAGSPGNETMYFGPITKAAVIKFQEKYASSVLAPWGLTSGTGYVGSTTRDKLNTMLVSADDDDDVVVDDDDDDAGGLTVLLAGDTPDEDTVATNANADFTKIKLRASSDGDVKISKIYVTRSGLSANSDIENIKIVDVDTGQYVGDIGSLNTNNKASISFIPKLEIEAGETREFYLRAGVVSTATAGKTAKLGIASADDIVSDADTVSGNFPVTGEAMTVVSLTIGSVTISEVTIVDSQPDVGDTDVDALEFKLAAGSTEPVTVETITVKEAGTADTSDTSNIELYDVTNGTSLGTVENWSSDEKATFSDLDLNIAKGKSIRLKVRVDVEGGVSSSTKTINVDIVDSSDTTVVVKGDTYGFYITPTRSPSDWDGKGVDQTIQAGALTVTRSADTPATGNISAGDDIELAVFDFEAKGEEIKITAMTVAFTIAGGAVASDVTNVKVYDEDGDIVAGPADVDSSEEVAYTDTFIVPVGTHQYTVKATVADSADAGNTVLAGIKTPGTTTVLTATGMTSGDSITATPAATVNANTLTVAAGALTVTTLADPAAKSVPSPTNDFVWATFSLDAASSGEDVNVTAITVSDSLSTGGAYADVDNAELWADLTSASSGRGDVYETRISDTEQWSAATRAFTLTQTLVVPSGTFRKIALVADLASGASGGHTFSIASDNVTATGAETAETVTPTYSTTSQQTMAVGSAALTITADASTPSAGIVIGNSDKTTLAVFKLAASNVEDLDLDQITVSATGGTYIDTLYFYDGDTQIHAVPGAASMTAVFADGTLTVPANDNKKVTLKADLLPVDGTTITNDSAMKLGLEINNSVQTTGLGSGASVDSGATAVYGNQMQIYESRPYFALNSSSPSGDLNPSSNTKVAIFDVTADAGEDITFETGDSSVIKINLDATVNDTSTNYVTLTLKEADTGNILGVDSVLIGAAGVNDGTTFTFDSTNSFAGTGGINTTYAWRIAAGTTEKLEAYLTTNNFEDDGDFVQIWLDDAAAANCTFGVDGTGTHAEGTYIFKSDIYAGSFVNPS